MITYLLGEGGLHEGGVGGPPVDSGVLQHLGQTLLPQSAVRLQDFVNVAEQPV